MKLSTAIAYASAWIATAIAVIFAMKYTGKVECLVCFVFPCLVSIFMTF